MHPEGIAPGQFPTSPLLQGGTVPVNRVPQRPVPGFTPAAKAGAAPAADLAADDDPFKDPRYIAASAKSEEFEGKAAGAMDQYAKDLTSFGDAPPPPEAPPLRTEAPKYAEFAKQASPMLMILTAIGGKAAGVSGMGMLGALTGIVEGTAEGNKDRYDAAYKEWQDHYQNLQDDWKNKMEVYKQNMAWRQGKIGAERDAVEAYRLMAGDHRQDAKNIAAEHTAYDRAMQKLTMSNLQLQNQHDRITAQHDVAEQKLGSDAAKQADKLSGNLPRTSVGYSSIQNAIDLLPQVIADVQKNNIPLPKSWTELAAYESSSTAIKQFVAYMQEAQPVMAAVETAGQNRSNMLLQGMAKETIPADIFTQTPESIRVKVLQANNVLRQSLTEQVDKIDMWANKAREHGYPYADITADIRSQLSAGHGNTPPPNVARDQPKKSFATEAEALASGVKGEVTIGGRPATID